MASPNGDKKGGGDGDQGKVKVGDKEYSAADVQNLITQVSTNAEKAESVQRILEVADRYELTPEEFAQQATGALGVINELITQGVIDNTGKLIVKKDKDPDKGDDDLTGDFLHGGEVDRQSAEKTEQIVGAALKSFMDKSLTPLLEKVQGEVKGVKDLQSTMIRNDYERQIREKYPNLDSDDVSKVFGESMASKKSLWDVAKEASEKKAVKEEEVARKWAKDHGIDYDEIQKDVNDLKEFGPGGAGAAALVKGKKISFDKKGDDYISPLEATKMLFKKKGIMR